ncbi:IST1 homolog [Nilaparvata lugens]|uniref:IST1 homolog n=1 Tax=Nilaparvata lugens TaxID=108931 RepID=UPI00193DE805|nr:IST1 homolog [Nilaparvata lugens]
MYMNASIIIKLLIEYKLVEESRRQVGKASLCPAQPLVRTLDPSIAEAVSSLLWVAPHLFADVSEMKVISDQLTVKYGKKYAEACRLSAVDTVSEKLKNKLSIHAPPKLLVEKYLVEIANSYNIKYEPDPQIMREDGQTKGLDALLFDGVPNDLSDKMMPPQPPGFVGYPQHPPLPPSDFHPFNYPSVPGATSKPPSAPFNQGGGGGGGMSQPPWAQTPPYHAGGHPNLAPEALIPPKEFSYNIPPLESFPSIDDNTAKPSNLPNPPPANYYPGGASNFADNNKQSNVQPKPLPRSKLNPADTILPELPSVPSDDIIIDNNLNQPRQPHPPPDDNEIDFDDIARRFEELKRRK